MASRPDQKVLRYLGRTLSLELIAVQQCSAQAWLVAAWGLNEVAYYCANVGDHDSNGR
jgi:bacterioferritin (cytochrome b1)